jgi:TonB family protein
MPRSLARMSILALALLLGPLCTYAQVPAQAAPDTFGAQIDRLPTLQKSPRWFFPLGHEHDRATVLLEFVVDSTGAVDSTTVTVISASNPAFEQAAIATLLTAHYRPAGFRGHPVRLLVRQSLIFDPSKHRCVYNPVTTMLPPKCY